MKKTLKHFTLLTASSALLLGSLISLTPIMAQEDNSEIIATVGDSEITKEELYQAMKGQAGNTTLRTLILEAVLEQNVSDAEALRTSADDEVKKQIEEAGGEEVFQQLLDYQGLADAETYTYQVFVSKMFQEVVKGKIDMSDEAIQSYYDNDYSPTMQAQHILVDTAEEAQKAIDRINDGEEFDAVAQELSKDSTASNGGLLEPFTPGQMVPEFEEAVKGQANGEVTQSPVESQYGFHVIKTLDNGEKKPLADIREQVEEQYVESKFNDSQFAYGIIGNLIQDTGYKINDEELQTAVQDLIDLANSSKEKEEATEDGVESAAEETSSQESSASEAAEEPTSDISSEASE